MNDLRKKIGRNIKKARLDADIAQEDLAKLVNTSYQHINKIENGNYSFLNIDLFYKISKVLKIELSKLFEIK